MTADAKHNPGYQKIMAFSQKEIKNTENSETNV